MRDINLLPHRRAKSEQIRKALKIMRIASIASLVFVLLISVLLFYLQVRSPLSALKKEEQSLMTSLTKTKEKIEKQAITKDRLTAIMPILAKRKDVSTVIDFFMQKAPNSVTITGLTITTESVNLIVNGASITAINHFLDELISEAAAKKVISKVTLDNFTADMKESDYGFTIKTDLVKK